VSGKNVGTWHQIEVWFSTGSNFTGADGVVGRLAQHASIWAEVMVIGAVVAIPLGVVLAQPRRGGVVVTSIANAARAVPILGILILLAAGALGVGRTTAVVALVIFAIPPMLTNTYTGIRGVSPDARAAAVGMGMTRLQLIRRVELPLAIPLIAAGVRLAAVQVWATATLAAIIGSGGLGQFVVDGYSVGDYGEVYGGVVIVVVTALIIDSTLGWLERVLGRRYGDSSSTATRRGRSSRADNGRVSVPA
jgi:osmoprotectant transport system permease protein